MTTESHHPPDGLLLAFDRTQRGAAELMPQLALWEDLLALVVDPDSPRVADRARKRELLSFLLERGGIDEAAFWNLGRGRRGRMFLARWSRVSREIPQLELTSFDLDKVLKERHRHEPLTVGAAWHHGFWRSYFSHAAITHPANDGLREEFSTAWDIGRRHPAVMFRTGAGIEFQPLRSIRLALPMIVGPFRHTDGITLERAWLEAVAGPQPADGPSGGSLVVVDGMRFMENVAELLPHARHLVVRVRHAQLAAIDAAWPSSAALRDLLAVARMIEVVWSPGIATDVAALRERHPELLVSVFMKYEAGGRIEAGQGTTQDFWRALEDTVRLESVAMIHYHAGPEKSYRLTPRIDAYLKARFLRARVQLVSAGGDTDTQASAATVYESVLLGANGGAMTDVAAIALLPGLIEVYHGADPAPVLEELKSLPKRELRELAANSLDCWQHSILDFLSCMGIDDIQKTSGNTMAITMTEDWIREVDALATPAFGAVNRELNAARIAAEPVPADVRERYRVSSLLTERVAELPLVAAAKILAHDNANFHLENTNRNLSADFLEVIYRMAAGELPTADEFLIDSDMGELSLDSVGVQVSRESIAWSLARLARDPALLDYVSLAVPRGFMRPGAVAAGARVEIRAASDGPALVAFTADARGGFEHPLAAGHPLDAALAGDSPLWLVVRDAAGAERRTELQALAHGGHGLGVARASRDGAVTLRRDPRGGVVIAGFGFREPIWHGPVAHASISLGAASEDFLTARIEGNAGLAMTSSGEGGPIRFAGGEMAWESMQAASGHFGIHAADLRRVRDVEIKINQGAKPGKGGRLSGAKVTSTVSRARNIPIGTDALSPDPKHDIYSIEDMPAEVWLWLLYHNHCGIKITGSNYTRFVAAGMWSNFVVDYLLVDAGLGGSGNYHADSSHVGWPDIFRTILHTHHALVSEKVDLDRSGRLQSLRDSNGAPFGATGGTRLLASGGLRGELDMIKVLIAGADALVEASIGKAVAFGCNQCGNCHLDCPRGGITTKPELTVQNDRVLMRQRFRNWTVLNMVKLAVLIDAMNRESGALDEAGQVAVASMLLSDIRQLRGRTDLLAMPVRPRPADGSVHGTVATPSAMTARAADASGAPAIVTSGAGAGTRLEPERDSCRVGSLAVSEPVTVHAIWESARLSYNGGNNRGGGIDFAGFAPAAVREKTCVIVNTIGPDRADTMREMLDHFAGCRFFDAAGAKLTLDQVRSRLPEFRVPVRGQCAAEDGWRLADLRENPGDFTVLFVDLRDDVLDRYGRMLLASEHWLQRLTKYGEFAAEPAPDQLEDFTADVREEYFTALAHLLDSRYYRTHAPAGSTPPAGKYAAKRRGFVVSMGEDLGAIKISGWTHTIPEYFDFDRFWAGYPGAAPDGVDMRIKGRPLRTTALHAHVWGMHHRYPTNSPAIDAEGRGNPAGAHPFKAYNVLLMHNGEQVAVDSTAPFLMEYGYVHADPTMGPGHADYHGDSVYERKALTDTEYAAYLVDFTRRVLGLTTEEASQIISPITGFDLANMDPVRRTKFELLMRNYVQLTPTGPYKFTIVESRRHHAPSANGGARSARVVGFRENMDIKFLRPHEIVVSTDTGKGGVHVVANGSEAKIADSMLRALHVQGVLPDAAHDLRFNMRPGGTPERRDYGGVFEAFTVPGSGRLDLSNRFGEPVEVARRGAKVDFAVPLDQAVARANGPWKQQIDARLRQLAAAVDPLADAAGRRRRFGPDDDLPAPASELLESLLDHTRSVTFEDYRCLVEHALPEWARGGATPEPVKDVRTAVALRILTELRKRVSLGDLGGKSLSSMEYLTDGGRSADGSPEGGVYRLLDRVTPLHAALAPPAPSGRWGRLTLGTRDDLLPPTDPERDVLVIDFRGFESESFRMDSASRTVSEAVRMGWRQFVGYDFIGGPRYIGTNLPAADGLAAVGVTLELYGREFGDFIGALLEGARVFVYGQGESHVGMKADSGYLFVLQDMLNTGMYAAHGGTVNVWDSGSRFAVAGQNKVLLADGKTPAPGFKSIHFGSPNEYAFEYLMSGGDNSFHVVMGLQKPDARGNLSLKPRPYSGKFFMSGAAAGRVFVFDPLVKLDPAQYTGNVLSAVTPEEWAREIGPFIADEAGRRGLPIRIEGDAIRIRLDGEWQRWHRDEAFAKLIPVRIAKAAQQQGIAPPALTQIVGE